jgi:hypothetical protein
VFVTVTESRLKVNTNLLLISIRTLRFSQSICLKKLQKTFFQFRNAKIIITQIIPARKPERCAICTNFCASVAFCFGNIPNIRVKNATVKIAFVIKEKSGFFIKKANTDIGNKA